MSHSAEKNSPVVLKFGGSSVAEIKHWKTIVERLEHELTNKKNPILVLSALKDVSNTLEGLLHLARAGEYLSAVTQLIDKHICFANELGLSVEHQLLDYGKQLKKACEEIFQQQSISPKKHAHVLAYGELMSTTIGHAFICQSGIPAKWYDARKLLVANSQTDQWHHYTSAVCHFDFSQQLSSQLLNPSESAKVIVTQGFIASDEQGDTVLLGREGSDTSAAYLAAKLGAKELQIWTDVTGIYTANPAEVSTAQQIDKLSYSQAHSMAMLGAKVLHPKVIRPVATNGIKLSVRSTWFPQRGGTEIGLLSDQNQDPLAVMLATSCTKLKIAQEDSTARRLEQVRTIVAELGFDILLLASTDQFKHLVLKYTNTDKPILTLAKLAALLKIRPQDINLDGSLLSVVGTGAGVDWLAKAQTSLQSSVNDIETTQFICLDESRVSFYLDTEVKQSALKLFHDKLFAA